MAMTCLFDPADDVSFWSIRCDRSAMVMSTRFSNATLNRIDYPSRDEPD